MFIKAIYQNKLKKYREKVDTQIQQTLKEKITDQEIFEMLNYALERGRRFRPLLFLLGYKMFERELPLQAYRMAGAIELLHKASLIHDDLLDQDEYRRGKESFYHQFGSRQAVIGGDLLVSLAFEEFLAATQESYLLQQWTKLYRVLCVGEMQDLLWEDQPHVSQDKLIEMIYGKTASFLDFVLRAGSYQATKDHTIAQQMGLMGTEIGIAFQIMNDWNNWQGLEAQLGRTPQKDIVSGKVNLVTNLVHSYQSQNFSTDQLKEQIEEDVDKLAREHIQKAQVILQEIGVHNRYSQVIEKVLQEFDQKWFWVDRDDL